MRYVMAFAICCFIQLATAQEISSFTLINAQEDIEIGILSDGDSISISAPNTNEYNLRANATGQIGSIVFKLDGEIVQAGNTAPYAFFGISENDYTSWVPELRTYTFAGSAYSLPQGQGTLLNTYSITITFVEEIIVGPLVPAVQSLVLINADSDEDIAEITEGSIFILEEIGTANLNIRAETDSLTQSVVFDYQGVANYHTENLPEYAIGANDGADYRPWTPDLGENAVTATAYSEDNGAGTSGYPLTVNFEIVEEVRDTIPPYVLRINSGGDAIVFNDSLSYMADTLFIGNGRAFANNNIADILETTQDSLYKTERTSSDSPESFGYSIPLNDGDYEIKFHFAEIFWGATGGGSGGEGKRIFNVAIEGEDVLTDFDMNVEKDAMTAIVKTYFTSVTDGELNISFDATVDQPKLAALEISELVDNTLGNCVWEELASSIPIPVEAQSIKVNDKLYVMSGFQTDSTVISLTQIYDPAIDFWSTGSPMPSAVSKMSTVGVGDEIWIIAGIEQDSLKTVTDRVQIYNTISDTWTAGPSLPSPRNSGAATFNEGKIHYLGGLLSDNETDAKEHYVLDVNDSLANWQVVSPLPNPRNRLSAAAVNGKIYAIGGQNTVDSLLQAQSFLDEYDPLSDSWTRKRDLPIGRSHFESGIGAHNNKILVVGGKSNDSILNTVSEYDVALNKWSELCRLPDSLIVSSAKVFGDNLIIVNQNGNTYSLTMETEIPKEPETPIEDEISVIVYHETGGFRHNSIEAGIDMVSEFGNDLGWKVNTSQTSDIFQADSLVTYDVVIWLNTTGEDLLTTDERLAFEEFIQNGGGFVGIHSATDTYRNGSWSWYNDLVGAIVQVNPYHTANNTNATIDVVGEHSTVQHLGNEWNKNEEYYYWERNGGYLFDGNIDLLRVQSTGPNSYDIARPVTWYKEYDGGRSFYTALGHNAADYDSNDKFRTMVKEAIIWAAAGVEPLDDKPEPAAVAPTENNSIVLFPNPMTNQLFVSSEFLYEVNTGEVSIFGMDGSLRKQKTINVSDNQIDMTDLPSGYYVAWLKAGTHSERHLIYKK